MARVCVACGSNDAGAGYAALPTGLLPPGARNTLPYCAREGHRALVLNAHGLLLDVVTRGTRPRGAWVNRKKRAYRKAWKRLKAPGDLPTPSELEGGVI